MALEEQIITELKKIRQAIEHQTKMLAMLVEALAEEIEEEPQSTTYLDGSPR